MFGTKPLTLNARIIFLAVFLIAAAIFFISGTYIHFHVVLNDFWGVLYYARHLSLSDAGSLYNGFFPIGYPILLHIVPDSLVIYFAFGLSIIFGGLFVGWTSGLFYLIKKSTWGAALLSLMTILFPLIFRYANTTSPDMGTAAFSMGGVYYLWKNEVTKGQNNHNILDDVICGVFLGISAIFRSHGIVSAAAILLAYIFTSGLAKLWQRKYIFIALSLVYFIQIGANLYSGHGAFETAQNFAVYITFHGMDWWHIPPEAYTFSVVRALFNNPVGFMKVYIPLFLRLAIYGFPSFLCLFFWRNQLEKRYAWFVFLATIIYAVPVAIGTSSTERGPFPILGMAVTCAGLLCMELWRRLHNILSSSRILNFAAVVVLISAGFWITGNWVSEIWSFLVQNRAANADFRNVEKIVVQNGLKKPEEIFTNDFDFYLPNEPAFQPYRNGGWENFSLWGYREEFPQIPTDSWESFSTASSARKIKFLVLTPGAGSTAGFLGKLYNDKFIPPNVELVAEVNNIKIYKFTQVATILVN